MLLCAIPSCVNGEDSCPELCQCSQDNTLGEVTVNCSATKMEALPHDLPSNTAYLYMDQNILKHVTMSLNELSHLKLLSLRNCNLVSLDFMETTDEAISTLQILDLTGNELQDFPQALPKTIKTIQVSNNNFTIISMNRLLHLTSLEELFLDHNGLTEVNETCFKVPDLVGATCMRSLRKIIFNDNNINNIAANAFEDLESLKMLTLANNYLSSLTRNIFTGLWNLQYLNLAGNQIATIGNDTFKNLESLRDLFLNNNELRVIPSGIPMLEWLDISGNKIQRVLEKDSKIDLYPSEVFSLARNPLHCDCDMLWLKELYDRRKKVFQHLSEHPDELIPTCSSPQDVEGQLWVDLSDAHFHCNNGIPSEVPALPSISPPVSEEHADTAPGMLRVRQGMTTDTTVEVLFKLEGQQTFTYLYIQYYAFGMREKTTKYSLVTLKDRRYNVENLRPETNYVICAIPKVSNAEPEQLSPLSLSHCLEVTTKDPPPVLILSYLTVFSYYIVGMLATVIILFCCIGALALLYGVVSARHSNWSAKEVELEIPVDLQTFSKSLTNAAKGIKPHKD